MISTEYRKRLEEICRNIVTGGEVTLSDMIWAEKLAKVNRSAGTMLRQARRKAENPDMQDGGMDDFLNRLDLGGFGDKRFGVKGFRSPEDIAEFFSDPDRPDDWRQRD